MSAAIEEKAARAVTPLGILVEHLEKAVEMMQQTNLPAELAASIQNARDLAAGIDPYLIECSTTESEALSLLARKTSTEDWSKRFSDGETVRRLEQEMLSGHVEGQVLKMFVHMCKAKRVLEIGMFTGYSALAMAEALPDDGYLVACEVDHYVANFAIECFKASPCGHKISVEVAPALETLRKLASAGESFDLVFIDADKKEYADYYQILIETGLLAPNGFICADNTLFQGEVYLPQRQRSTNGEAIARFNRMVANDPRVDRVLLPIRDGLTVIRRK